MNELQNGIGFSPPDARIPMELLPPMTGRQILLGYKYFSKDALNEKIARGLFSSKTELEGMILEFEKENIPKTISRKAIKDMKRDAHKALNKAMSAEL